MPRPNGAGLYRPQSSGQARRKTTLTLGPTSLGAWGIVRLLDDVWHDPKERGERRPIRRGESMQL